MTKLKIWCARAFLLECPSLPAIVSEEVYEVGKAGDVNWEYFKLVRLSDYEELMKVLKATNTKLNRAGVRFTRAEEAITWQGVHHMNTEDLIRELKADVDKFATALDRLTMKMNPVTAAHRHGNAISEDALDQMSNAQIDAEEILKTHSKVVTPGVNE